MSDPRPAARWRTAVAVTLLAATVGACSSGGEGAPSPSASVSESPSAPTEVAHIGVISSHRGDLAPVGKGVRDAVELAVREANSIQAVPGWSFDAVQGDDTSTQSGGQQAASGLAADQRTVGVVGTTRSVIDEGVQPILNNARVAMVSPGGTATSLTKRSSGSGLVRPFATYFRLAPTDGDEGVAAARHLDDLRVRRVAVLSDGSSYGRLLASTFAAESARLGGERPVVRTLTIPSTMSESTAQARRERAAEAVRRGRVGAVFFGGDSSSAAAFADVLRAEKVRAPLVGGDALLDGRYVRELTPPSSTAKSDATRSATTATATPTATAGPGEGDMAVFAGAPATDLDAAQGFLRRYRAAGYGADPGPYGASAYDAAWAIIRAFGASVGDATEIDRGVRDGVVAALGTTRFEGATGPVSFDRFGDARERPLAVYSLVSGRWEVSAIVRVGSAVGGRS